MFYDDVKNVNDVLKIQIFLAHIFEYFDIFTF